jgi:hypothetical protein
LKIGTVNEASFCLNWGKTLLTGVRSEPPAVKVKEDVLGMEKGVAGAGSGSDGREMKVLLAWLKREARLCCLALP